MSLRRKSIIAKPLRLLLETRRQLSFLTSTSPDSAEFTETKR